MGSVELLTRPAVAIREQPFRRAVGLYLSLYDDEIYERAEAFWAASDQFMLEPAWQNLELTDAAILVDTEGGEVRVARGGACTFPLYWRGDDSRLRFSTVLPLASDETFSGAGLLASAAAACVHSSYEPNTFTNTPLANWRRIRRAAVQLFCSGKPTSERIIGDLADHYSMPSSREAIANSVRGALDAYGHSQRRVKSSVLELSGGFDSTLAPAAISPRHAMRGISVVFPYYEFRFEAAIQRAVATALDIPRFELDGTDLFPYTPSQAVVRFDEPTVFVTGIRHAESVARFAAEGGATRVYTGHGGDQCFATNLIAREELVASPLTRGPFMPRTWRTLKIAMETIRNSSWMERRLGTFVNDARQDVWAKESYGVTIRTPFSDLPMFRSAMAWSLWCNARGIRPDKTILATATSGLLPKAVLERKGKVAYDGVWTRAYRVQADHIAEVFESTNEVLTHLGVSPAWLIRRVRDLARWRSKSDREVLAMYAISTWLMNWGIKRAKDVEWSSG